MPTAIPANPRTEGLPDWLQEILNTVSVNPASTSVGSAGAKGLLELLGEVLTPSRAAKDLPRRIRLSSLDPAAGKAMLHAVGDFQPFESSYADLQKLLGSGELVKEGPDATRSIPQLVRRLKKVAP